MILFMAIYHTLPEYRSVCAAAFADRKRDAGDCRVLGEWMSLGEGTLHVLVSAPSATAVGTRVRDWIGTRGACRIRPVVDDHQARTIVLAKSTGHQEPTRAALAEQHECDATVCERVGDDAPEGWSLFLVHWRFDFAHRIEAMLVFAGLTEEDHKLDRGDVVTMGRYHSIGDGTGTVVCAAKSGFDLHKWAYNWCHLADVDIQPVVSGREARRIIVNRPGFENNLAKARVAGLIDALSTDTVRFV